jgi:CheY-like chemotaxis protein
MPFTGEPLRHRCRFQGEAGVEAGDCDNLRGMLRAVQWEVRPVGIPLEQPPDESPRGDLELGPRVLIVDDADDAREVLAQFVILLGHDVRTARSGREALELAASFLPQVIFLDIGMPELDGYEVCSRLRTRQSMQDTAIYAVTGFGSDQHRVRSKQAGFDGHLMKPLDLDHIAELLSGEREDYL